MIETFRKNNMQCSQITTRRYSTSFSLGVMMLDKKYRDHIYRIYGFVRYADEIVDTFFGFDRKSRDKISIQQVYLAYDPGHVIHSDR